MISKTCKIRFDCPPPRVRLAGLRSNAAVNMVGHGAAETLNLFSSGNAQHAVPRNTWLPLCWSYANNVWNNLPQPWHSVLMARLWIILHTMNAMNASHYSIRRQHQPEWKKYKIYSNTWIKKLIQRPHSRIWTSEEQFFVQTMHFAICSMLFLEDRPKIGAVRANS